MKKPLTFPPRAYGDYITFIGQSRAVSLDCPVSIARVCAHMQGFRLYHLSRLCGFGGLGADSPQ